MHGGHGHGPARARARARAPDSSDRVGERSSSQSMSGSLGPPNYIPRALGTSTPVPTHALATKELATQQLAVPPIGQGLGAAEAWTAAAGYAVHLPQQTATGPSSRGGSWDFSAYLDASPATATSTTNHASQTLYYQRDMGDETSVTVSPDAQHHSSQR